MFCPSCGQEQIAEDTRFCSRCGLLLTAVSDVMHNNGLLPQNLLPAVSNRKWYQKRGFKQGLFIFLLSFLIVPLIAILTVAADGEFYAVVISAILLSVGGFLRMVYSFMFEADEPNQTVSEQENIKYLGKTKSANALPPPQSIPTSTYIPPKQGNWRDTNDLVQPSVTEGTTKLLEREK
jgi:hypothetical protein